MVVTAAVALGASSQADDVKAAIDALERLCARRAAVGD